MNKIEFIKVCHNAQNDAGSLEFFTNAVETAAHSLEHNTGKIPDPVAAFLGALIAMHPEFNKQDENFCLDLDFYTGELNRINEAINKAIYPEL